MRNARDRRTGRALPRARRWAVLAGAALAGVAALGACGGDDGGDGGDGDGQGGGGVQLPTGRDDVVLRLGEGPVPTLLIAGDGAVYELADVPLPGDGWSGAAPAGQGFVAIAPLPAGPMPMTVRQLNDEGLQRVFERADELGLLGTPPDYAEVNVTDSGSTYLELSDADGTYEHVAYALGYDDPEVDDERQAFSAMVQELGDIERLAGRRNISEAEAYVPATYRVLADAGYVSDGRQWPAAVPFEEGCVELPLDRFPDGVAGTYLYEVDDASPTRVWVVPDLPGDDC